MPDFFRIGSRIKSEGTRNEVMELYPQFILKNPSDDLMIRGGDFYAVWNESTNLWSTREQDVIDMIDARLDEVKEKKSKEYPGKIRAMYMWNAETGSIDAWHKYC